MRYQCKNRNNADHITDKLRDKFEGDRVTNTIVYINSSGLILGSVDIPDSRMLRNIRCSVCGKKATVVADDQDL